MEKGKFIPARSTCISVKTHHVSQNNNQLSKTYKSVAIFSLNNADFTKLTPLSPRKPLSDCVSF